MDEHNLSWPGWETGEQIGKGSCGTVYRLSRSGSFGLQEEAALKHLSIPQDEDEIRAMRMSGLDNESISTQLREQVESLVGEYKIMMGLKNCPNIVHCDDFRVVERELGYTVLLKMELLTPLNEVIRQGGMNSEAQVIRLGSHLCNALAVCQEKSILHRDVKPQNIFLAPDGNFKLGDFGIARTMEKGGQATVGIGTYNYMAPEVFNRRPYDSRADVYSLGLVLYWLLNGRRGPFLPLRPAPITSQDQENARYRRFSGEALPPPALGSEALQAIVLKACAFQPEQRYPTAAAMKEDLDALARGEVEQLSIWDQTEEEKPAPQNQEPRQGKKRVWLKWALAAVLCCELVVLANVLVKNRELRSQAAQTQQTQEKADTSLAAPELSIQPGTYYETLQLEISCDDPDAEIYVTMQMDSENKYRVPGFFDIAYTEPIFLSRGTSTVTAYARKGDQVSQVITVQYTVIIGEVQVTFREPVIEQFVRAQLGQLEGQITNHDCERITDIYIYNNGTGESVTLPRSLEDLQYFPNLRSLRLPEGTQIADYAPLAHCPRLDTLYFYQIPLENLDFLKFCPGIVSLTAEQCGIRDFSGLAYGENLRKLTLGWEDIRMEQLLRDHPHLYHLEELLFFGAEPEDLTAIGGMENLRRLSIIPDYEVFVQMKNLSFLKNLTRLEELYLLGEVSSIQQLKVLYGLTSLKHLSLTGPVTTYASAMEELQKALPGCSIEY